jgi:sialate O-acetylesterase
MRSYLLFFALIISSFLFGQQKIKVACIGNSVTYGYTIHNREVNSYPSQLQAILGKGYDVGNFGKSGATLLYKGHRPYVAQEEFKEAMHFAADRVIIDLGLNDTYPRDWPNYGDSFIPDYLALIDSLRKANPSCHIWICLMTPISPLHPRFEAGTLTWYDLIQKCIRKVALIAHTGLIDFKSPLFDRPDLFNDALHPNAEGAKLLAQSAYEALTGNFGGLQMPVTYSDNMVLQRNTPVFIRGIANYKDTVVVRIDSQEKRAVTGTNGHWTVRLSPMKAGGPFELSVKTSTKSLLFKNVMIGEVWLCSGQSNMAFPLVNSIGGKAEVNHPDQHLRVLDLLPKYTTDNVAWDSLALSQVNKLHYYQHPQWSALSGKNSAQVSAVAYYFGKMLADSLHVTVGLICNAVGGSDIASWIDRSSLEHNPHLVSLFFHWRTNPMFQDWVQQRTDTNLALSKNPLQRHPYEPCYLYEAGTLPLDTFSIRGVIWYQGESDAQNMELYEETFPLLIQSWRQVWGESLPFYFVQLPSLSRPSWTNFRNCQRLMAQEIPNVYMTVSSDVGDSLNVHPENKLPVGERLACSALYYLFQHPVIPSGPIFQSVIFRKAIAILHFKFAKGLRSADGRPLRTFEIAGQDGIYYPANAIIVKNTVQVFSPKVNNPAFVRYGWEPYTRANLVNQAGFPASTFKTGDVLDSYLVH